MPTLREVKFALAEIQRSCPELYERIEKRTDYPDNDRFASDDSYNDAVDTAEWKALIQIAQEDLRPSTAYTFYKGVSSWAEALLYFENNGELPDCEMFARLSKGDQELAKELGGYIAQESTDPDLIRQIPKTLKEALL